MVRLVLQRPLRVLVVPALAAIDRHIEPGEADSKQDVEHRSAEASAESHDWVPETCNSDISNQVSQRVADCENSESEDSIRYVEDNAQCFENANDFACNSRDPGYGDDESEKAEEVTMLWSAVGSGEEKEEGKHDQAADEGVEEREEEAPRVGWLEICVDEEENEKGCSEYLCGYQPAIPVFWGGR